MVDEKSFKNKISEVKIKYNLSSYEILQRYMFERIIERISVSKYNDNFILKGGLLLSAIFGVDNRTTKDMDATIKGIDIERDTMVKILEEILAIDVDDNVNFIISDITNIRDNDIYGGNKYHIVGKVFNTSVNLEIDISTGDSITPKELKYKYESLFDDKSFLISSYNLETILAEKIETLLHRGKFNSRMKDFYDVYMFLTILKKDINIDILNKAIKHTFVKRETMNYLNDYSEIIDEIIKSENIHGLWDSYCKKYSYATNIQINDIMEILKDFIKLNIKID